MRRRFNYCSWTTVVPTFRDNKDMKQVHLYFLRKISIYKGSADAILIISFHCCNYRFSNGQIFLCEIPKNICNITNQTWRKWKWMQGSPELVSSHWYQDQQGEDWSEKWEQREDDENIERNKQYSQYSISYYITKTD